MKKIIVLFILGLALGCKNDPKDNTESKSVEQINEKEKTVLKNILLPKYPLWLLKNISLSDKNSNFDAYNIFELKRTSTTQPAYVLVNNISINKNSTYRVSVIVKKGNAKTSFGLRLMDKYPNRVDAVFNLNDLAKKDVIGTGAFLNGYATIEHLKSDWYKCSLTAKASAENVKIIFGPTTDDSKTITWEAENKANNNVLILPSSLILEELSN